MAKDSKMFYLEDDIQKIQVKTNMYINEYGEAGAFHLAREVIQNDFDECIDPDSPGNKIEIEYDKATDIMTVSDNGRGFDETDYPMNIFCTKLQSGSKFFRSNDVSTSGEFGVGLTAVNALSDIYEMESYREREQTYHKIIYENGILKSDESRKLKKNEKQHGTSIRFKASKTYLGEDTNMPIEEVIEWVEKLFYLDSERLRKHKVTCDLLVYDGFKLEEKKKFSPKDFSDLIDRITPNNIKKNNLSQKIGFSGDKSFVENSKSLVSSDDGSLNVEMVKLNKNIHLDVVFRYATLAEMNEIATYDTYCNYTNTTENGTHLIAFEESFCRYIQNAVNATMSDSQRDKLKVIWDDIRTNLFAVINLSTNAQVGFVGNEKAKINAPDLLPHMKDIINENLDSYFKENQTYLNEIIRIVKLNAKARLEATKAKSATQTERLNSMKEHTLTNYIRCNNTGKKFKEIFLVEGNSAAGSFRNGSDPDTQAAFLFRGVTMNAEKASLTEVMNNREWRDLVTILRCGIGPKFDLSKLYYDRINIFTDEDVDGKYISAGMLTFFYRFMRPIIEEGRLYKVFTPLYQLYDKEHEFVANKTEMVNLYHNKIAKHYKMKLSNGEKFDKDDIVDFLLDTYDYRENLIRAAKDSGNVNKYFLEFILYILVKMGIDETNFEHKFKDQKVITKIMNDVQKKYKEIKVDDTGKFYGIIEGKYILIKISSRFFKKTSELIPLIKEYGYEITVTEKNKDNPKVLSIGKFLDESQKLMPKIKTRFKGLGELNGDQLRSTALDFNKRVSIQFTVDDVERELKIFSITHGNSKDDCEKRKQMMKDFKISRDDLDN